MSRHSKSLLHLIMARPLMPGRNNGKRICSCNANFCFQYQVTDPYTQQIHSGQWISYSTWRWHAKEEETWLKLQQDQDDAHWSSSAMYILCCPTHHTIIQHITRQLKAQFPLLHLVMPGPNSLACSQLLDKFASHFWMQLSRYVQTCRRIFQREHEEEPTYSHILKETTSMVTEIMHTKMSLQAIKGHLRYYFTYKVSTATWSW